MPSMRRLPSATHLPSSCHAAAISAVVASPPPPRRWQDLFINFRAKAPIAATETMYLDAVGEIVPDLSLRGYKAVAVPGSVLGLDTILDQYGTMARDKVIAPAIRLAEDGFVLTAGDVEYLASAPRLSPASRTWRRFSFGTAALADGRASRPERPCRDPSIHRQGWSGRLLQRADRRCDRGGKRGQWRHPDQTGFRKLHHLRDGTDTLRLSRLRHHLGAAAELGWYDTLRDPQHPRGLPDEELGFHSAAGIHYAVEEQSVTPTSIAILNSGTRISSRTRSTASCRRTTAATIRAKIADGRAGNSKDTQAGCAAA